MWYFERNYVALTAMLEQTQLEQHGVLNFELAGCPVEISIVERTRYTTLIRIHQELVNQASFLSDIVFDVRIYDDAQLAEVISYQGKKRIKYKYAYPNNNMYVPDEKRQGNLLLHDWLLTCARLDYQDNLIEKV
ncbi:MAG: DUF1249 domain-containing protein [Thioalkalispiraceae bacterium]|jgi:uncharacterized protein YqiB (DUF1249 family)